MNLDRAKAILLLALLFGACMCIAFSLLWEHSKWLSSAGLMFDLAGIVQLEISGLFERIINKYGDEEKYPGGPPSHITRRIIDDPDKPIRSYLHNLLFFELKTGFRLIVIGCVFQLAGVWS
jgi:hypothetical protein